MDYNDYSRRYETFFEDLPKGIEVDSSVKNSFEEWKNNRKYFYYKKIAVSIFLIIFFGLFFFSFGDSGFGIFLAYVLLLGVNLWKVYFYIQECKKLKKVDIIYCNRGIVVEKKRYNTSARTIIMANDIFVKMNDKEFLIKTSNVDEYKNIDIDENIIIFAVDKHDLYVMKDIG